MASREKAIAASRLVGGSPVMRGNSYHPWSNRNELNKGPVGRGRPALLQSEGTWDPRIPDNTPEELAIYEARRKIIEDNRKQYTRLLYTPMKTGEIRYAFDPGLHKFDACRVESMWFKKESENSSKHFILFGFSFLFIAYGGYVYLKRTQDLLELGVDPVTSYLNLAAHEKMAMDRNAKQYPPRESKIWQKYLQIQKEMEQKK